MRIPGVWRLQRLADAIAPQVGWDKRNWLRVKQIGAFEEFLASRMPQRVLEISPGSWSPWRRSTYAYTEVHYPEFDICTDRLTERFEMIIADQVLEHVRVPLDALRNMHAMLSPTGAIAIATPFLFRVHGRPNDFTRWTEAGLRELVSQAGFDTADMMTGSWGNKACARAHIGGPVRDAGWFPDLSNDPEYPMMVWAFALKSV